MSKELLQKLLDDYVMGTISPEDRQRLLSSLQDPDLSDEVKAILLQDLQTSHYDSADIPEIRERLQGRLHSIINASSPAKPAPRIHFIRKSWFKYAAAILIVLAAVGYLWINTRTSKDLATSNNNKKIKTDIPPGGEKAILTLADGSKIILDHAANGNLAQQGNTEVIKLSNGQLAYQLKKSADTKVMWNTMTTPSGGQYQVTLPDGTKVWLNATSSITYPTAFVDKKRSVKISGEVYFEVAKDNEKPFIVDVDGRSNVQVLGTSFNINSYRDEATIKTTLLEGSVKVSKATQSIVLKPGEQAVAVSSDQQPNNAAGILVVNKPDIEQTLAWKNGLFNFNGANLQVVMRQLERWYNIKVKYEGAGPKTKFSGEIYRNVHLSDVLDALQSMGVKYRLEDKVLVVL